MQLQFFAYWCIKTLRLACERAASECTTCLVIWRENSSSPIGISCPEVKRLVNVFHAVHIAKNLCRQSSCRRTRSTFQKPICQKEWPVRDSGIDHDIDSGSAFHDWLIVNSATVVIGCAPNTSARKRSSPDKSMPGSASDPTSGSARVSPSSRMGF